jgi:hypothetical protein
MTEPEFATGTASDGQPSIYEVDQSQAEVQDCERLIEQIEAAMRMGGFIDAAETEEVAREVLPILRRHLALTGKQSPAEPQEDVVEVLAKWIFDRFMQDRRQDGDWETLADKLKTGWRNEARKLLADLTPLFDVRERLEGLVNAVAKAWPVICDGTPDEVAPVREALRNARAALDTPAPSEPEEGK